MASPPRATRAVKQRLRLIPEVLQRKVDKPAPELGVGGVHGRDLRGRVAEPDDVAVVVAQPPLGVGLGFGRIVASEIEVPKTEYVSESGIKWVNGLVQ